MDDYSLSTLNEGKNEWTARLINKISPAIIHGVRSIFDEAYRVCMESDGDDQYLVAFQTYLARVPHWNKSIIEDERKRVIEVSNCDYLEDLITCVHVIQLKALTCVRASNEQRRVEIDVPDVDTFIHRTYINLARQLYSNIYLFEKNVPSLVQQRNNRELEHIVMESILRTVRDSVPVEAILRAYIDETECEVEERVAVDEKEVETAECGSAFDGSTKPPLSETHVLPTDTTKTAGPNIDTPETDQKNADSAENSTTVSGTGEAEGTDSAEVGKSKEIDSPSPSASVDLQNQQVNIETQVLGHKGPAEEAITESSPSASDTGVQDKTENVGDDTLDEESKLNVRFSETNEAMSVGGELETSLPMSAGDLDGERLSFVDDATSCAPKVAALPF